MKICIIVMLFSSTFVSCKHKSYRSSAQHTEGSRPAIPKTGEKKAALQPGNSYSRTGSSSPRPQGGRDKLSVEVVKQIQLGASIESFFANVFTRQGAKKSYIATKIPCQASQGKTRDEGDFDCKFMENDLDVDIKIDRKGSQTASVSIPGDPSGPHTLRCSLKYDYQSAQNRGPESTRDGSVLHRLQEVNCAE